MRRVEVERASFAFPESCACCLAPATHNVASQKTKRVFLGVATVSRALSIEVPYCEACSDHVLWGENGGITSILVRAAAVIVAAAALGALLSLIIVEVIPALVWGVGSPAPTQGGRIASLSLLVLPLLSCAMPFIAAGLYVRNRLRSRPRGRLDARHCRERHAVQLLDFGEDRLTLGVWNEDYADMLARASTA